MRKYYSVCDWLGNELFASNDEWEAVDWYDEHENGDADLQLFVYDEEPVVPEETYDAFAYGHELTNKRLYRFHYQTKHAFTKDMEREVIKMKDDMNLTTKMIELKETAYGEAILTLKRGNEIKQTVLANTGLSEVVYESAIDYYMYDLNWTEKQFDHYWDNGGEDKEIDNYIEGTVDYYNGNSEWQELN